MNRKFIVACAFTVLAAGVATAQPAIKVKKGNTFTYNTVSDMEMVTSAMGQEQTQETKTVGTTILTVGAVDKQKINWVMAMPELRVTMSMPMGGGIDTTISAPPQNYVTNPAGKVISAPASADAAGMEMMMGGSMLKNFALWFVPALARGAQSGATWEELRRDTMNYNPSNDESGGVNIISTQNLRFTYDGITDTLGVKVARVRWSSTNVTYEGSGTIQDMAMTIEGDGGISGISYYSTKDGLLLASTTDVESNMRLGISPGGQPMVIPMVQTTRTSISRKD